jgi:hypothetical protein
VECSPGDLVGLACVRRGGGDGPSVRVTDSLRDGRAATAGDGARHCSTRRVTDSPPGARRAGGRAAGSLVRRGTSFTLPGWTEGTTISRSR